MHARHESLPLDYLHMTRMTRARVIVSIIILGFTIVATAAFATSSVKARWCGYAHSKAWGRVALYPWRMSCDAARRTLAKSESRHDPIISFTADGAHTFDAAAVKIADKWWVCGGRMGYYFCGYPYRPATAPGVGGGTTYRGPFKKELVFEACADGSYLCKRHAQTYQPPRSYS